jgi:hypothetical protein
MTFDLGMWPLTSSTNVGSYVLPLIQVWDNIGFDWGRYTEYRMRPEKNRMSVANPIFFMVESDIQCIARNNESNIIIIMFLKSDWIQNFFFFLDFFWIFFFFFCFFFFFFFCDFFFWIFFLRFFFEIFFFEIFFWDFFFLRFFFEIFFENFVKKISEKRNWSEILL